MVGGARLGGSGGRVPDRGARRAARLAGVGTGAGADHGHGRLPEHLDAIAAGGAAGPVRSASTSTPAGGVGVMTIGAKRSPLHDPAQMGEFAREIVARPELRARRADGLRGPDRGGRRPPARQAADAARAAGRAGALRARARAAAGGDRRRGAVGRAAAVRQRRRHGLDGAHRGRARGDRGRGRQRAVRPDAVRHLPRLQARAGRAVRAAGGAQADGEGSPPRWAAATRRRARRGAIGCRGRSCRRA